jgi:hypothetical protein
MGEIKSDSEAGLLQRSNNKKLRGKTSYIVSETELHEFATLGCFAVGLRVG